MKPTAYLETTIPSYLTSRPSRDLIVAAHQQLTHDWWLGARENLSLVVSEAVVVEIQAGDSETAERRLRLVEDLPVLRQTLEVESLAELFRWSLGLHSGAAADLLHIAFAVAYEVDYLVTWNCKHIANGHVVRRLQKLNETARRKTPVILTPEELLSGPGGSL
jgi:predicted nucleic acid-binding protein